MFFVNLYKWLIFLFKVICLCKDGLVGLFFLLGNNVGKVIVVKNEVVYLFKGLFFIEG